MRRYLATLTALAALAPAVVFGETAPISGTSATLAPTSTKLAYVMVFVSDMKRSVAYYQHQVGLKLRFTSPEWSEFDTGGAILALHPAGPNNKAGTSEVGVTVQDLNAFYDARISAGVSFTGPPKPQSYGSTLTEMHHPDGASVSVAGQ